MDCRVGGVGVDPRRPPLIWEAWTGSGWTACEVDRDETGGLNKAGDVVLHVPDEPRDVDPGPATGRAGCAAGCWSPEEGQPTYTASPRILSVSGVHHRRHRPDGARRGRPRRGRRASPTAPPASGSRCSAGRWCRGRSRACCRSSTTTGVEPTGRRCEHFAESGPDETVHSSSTRSPARCSSARRCGRATARCASTARCRRKGAHLRLSVVPHRRRACAATWRTGQVRVLKTSVPYVARVENRTPGGRRRRRRDIEDAKLRGPLVLRSRGRAVTAEDFDELTSRSRRRSPGCTALGADGRRRPGAGGAVRGHRRRRPDPPGRPDPAARVARPDQPRTWTNAGWSAPGW